MGWAVEIDIPDLKELLKERGQELIADITAETEGEISGLLSSVTPSGAIYRRSPNFANWANPKTKQVHQASAPGEPPAQDTSHLFQSLTYEVTDLTGEIILADYAEYLEFGTEKMAARPFIIPSLEEVLQRI